MDVVVPRIPKRVTMKDQVYETLRALILNGKLLPGQPLVEAQLSLQLGTSKTPLREAFLRLEADGLVTLSPHKGASVTRLSLGELRNCQFVRLTLEVAAFELLVQQITPTEVAEARRWLARMQEEVQRGDWDAYHAAHRQFHATLYDATRNPVLADMLLDLFDRMQRYSQFCLERNHEYWKKDEQDHLATFVALERKDVNTFRETFRRMNDSFASYIEEALRRRDADLAGYFVDGPRSGGTGKPSAG